MVQIAIHESRTVGDAQGRAVLVVQRIQGTQGLVNVRWRLNVGAQDDFLPPLEGSLQFTQVAFLAASLASFGLQKSLIIILKWISIAQFPPTTPKRIGEHTMLYNTVKTSFVFFKIPATL